MSSREADFQGNRLFHCSLSRVHFTWAVPLLPSLLPTQEVASGQCQASLGRKSSPGKPLRKPSYWHASEKSWAKTSKGKWLHHMCSSVKDYSEEAAQECERKFGLMSWLMMF